MYCLFKRRFSLTSPPFSLTFNALGPQPPPPPVLRIALPSFFGPFICHFLATCFKSWRMFYIYVEKCGDRFKSGKYWRCSVRTTRQRPAKGQGHRHSRWHYNTKSDSLSSFSSPLFCFSSLQRASQGHHILSVAVCLLFSAFYVLSVRPLNDVGPSEINHPSRQPVGAATHCQSSAPAPSPALPAPFRDRESETRLLVDDLERSQIAKHLFDGDP